MIRRFERLAAVYKTVRRDGVIGEVSWIGKSDISLQKDCRDRRC